MFHGRIIAGGSVSHLAAAATLTVGQGCSATIGATTAGRYIVTLTEAVTAANAMILATEINALGTTTTPRVVYAVHTSATTVEFQVWTVDPTPALSATGGTFSFLVFDLNNI